MMHREINTVLNRIAICLGAKNGTKEILQTLSAELLFSISWSNYVSILDLTQSPEVGPAKGGALGSCKRRKNISGP